MRLRALLAAALLAPILAEGRPPAVHVVLINGGHRAKSNYESHLVHLERMAAVLRDRGLSAQTVFAADGEDPARDMAVREPFTDPLRWLIDGTDADRLLPRTHLRDTPWDGPRQPATSEALSGWFASSPVEAGDTLLLYTTDHGWRDRETGDAGLWLWEEKAAPEAMATWLSALPEESTTVMVMSHCFSGAFAEVVLEGPLDGSVCGFFSAPKERRAYGCYPEGRSTTIGHGFRFIDALSHAGSAAAAHRRVLLTDRTPDVPLATSDLYLRQLIEAEAAAAGVSLGERVDALLGGAGRPEAVSVMARGVGLDVPGTMAEVAGQRAVLEDAEAAGEQSRKLWAARLEELAAGHLAVFLDADPAWAARIEGSKAEDRAEAAALIVALRAHAEAAGLWGLLSGVAQKHQEAVDIVWRGKVREAVLLRIEAALIRQAGEALLSGRGKRGARKRLQKLERCEATPLGRPTGSPGPLPADWPALEDDHQPHHRPSFIGVRLEALDDPVADGLLRGAVEVSSVLAGNPAEDAGLKPGDVLTGPPGRPFLVPQQARSWAAMLPVGQPAAVVLRRGDATLTVEITPVRFPDPG